MEKLEKTYHASGKTMEPIEYPEEKTLNTAKRVTYAAEVVLDRQEAQFLLISLQKALKMEKKCCDNQTKLYNHDETKWSCFYCGAHN